LAKKLIIAIDGPSGVGKSTLSQKLAAELDYLNIDTGAMYRSVAVLVKTQQIDPQNGEQLEELCRDLTIRFERGADRERVLANDVDVTTAIRTPEISQLTPQVATQPVVREALVRIQREMGKAGGVVLEGRDIGTVVFPHADIKFFLVASAEERGKRRYEELRQKGLNVDLRQTIVEIEARDKVDMARTLSPLKQADDAVVIDTTYLSIDGVLDEMLRVVRNKQAEGAVKGE
jgi:cytidylate kinase